MRIDSWLSPKCEARQIKMGGRGIFAREQIVQRELVAIWGGPIVTTSEVDAISKIDLTYEQYTVSIHPGFHLGINRYSSGLDDALYFNHSCEPNIGVKGQVIVLARRLVQADEELCFDYDTTEITPPSPHFHCHCGSPRCRGVIDGTSWQNPDFIRRNRDWLSWNVAEHIRRYADESARQSFEESHGEK